MGEPLEYDTDEARQEEGIYETAAMNDRRQLVRDRLDSESGETVLSIGCGPGFEPAERIDGLEAVQFTQGRADSAGGRSKDVVIEPADRFGGDVAALDFRHGDVRRGE